MHIREGIIHPRMEILIIIMVRTGVDMDIMGDTDIMIMPAIMAADGSYLKPDQLVWFFLCICMVLAKSPDFLCILFFLR